jgi:hypothetical protein
LLFDVLADHDGQETGGCTGYGSELGALDDRQAGVGVFGPGMTSASRAAGSSQPEGVTPPPWDAVAAGIAYEKR